MPQLTPAELGTSPSQDEEVYVHKVYDSIASHFSQTRYKPWPLISTFLSSLPPGSVGLDSGTGNGKYLPLNMEGAIYTIGLDRSVKLLEIAKQAGNKDRDVVLGDAMGLGWRSECFDFAISIATIHHLTTADRRCKAIQALIKCLSPSHGRFLVYVWATEQDDLSKRVVPDAKSPGEKAQDVLVPWVQTIGNSKTPDTPHDTPFSSSQSPTTDTKVFQRYYHLFAPSELHDLTCRAAVELGLAVGSPDIKLSDPHNRSPSHGLEIVNEGWVRSNYYVEARLWTQTLL